MAKKYLSLERLTEYDTLIKQKIDDGLNSKSDLNHTHTWQQLENKPFGAGLVTEFVAELWLQGGDEWKDTFINTVIPECSGYQTIVETYYDNYTARWNGEVLYFGDYYIENDNGNVTTNYDGSSLYIYKKVHKMTQLSEIYIPDTIARTDYVDNHVLNTDNPHNTSWENLIDKPFGATSTQLVAEIQDLNISTTERSDWYEYAINDMNNHLGGVSTYHIDFDYVGYECEIKSPHIEDDETYTYSLGNKNIVDATAEDTGEPFYIYERYFDGDVYSTYYVCTRDAGDYVISMYKEESVVTQLSEAYIPDTIARTDYVDANLSAIRYDLENIDLSGYETKEDATAKLDEAKLYADSATTALKNELLNGAGEAYDTLKELGDLIDENQDAIDALEIIAAAKSDWEQNDETAPDYIKNRTHYDNRTSAPLNLVFNGDYENYEHKLIVDAGTSQIYVVKVSDSVISHEDLSGCNVAYASTNEVNNYVYTNYNASEYFGLNGNNSSSSNDFIIRDDEVEVMPNIVLSKGIWFGLFILNHKPNSYISSLTSDTVMLEKGELKKLDEKFLPDNIATEEYVDEVTSEIQAQLDGKAASGHTHTNASLGQGTGYCSTDSSTVEKVVSLSDYEDETGGIVSVEFVYSVPDSATMNINGKGAKQIYYRGSAITKNVIKGGDVATFIYDSSRYHLISVDRWHKDIVDLQANDSKVTQKPQSANSNYPLLFAQNFQTEETTGFTYFNSDIYVNPSINKIYADIDGTAAKAIANEDGKKLATEEYVDSKLLESGNGNNNDAIDKLQTSINSINNNINSISNNVLNKISKPKNVSAGDVISAKSDGNGLIEYEASNPSELIFDKIRLKDASNGLTYFLQIVDGTLITTLAIAELRITSLPTKLFYNTGEEIDISGLSIELVNDNGTAQTITDYTYSPNIMSDSDSMEIIIEYEMGGQIYSNTFEVYGSVEQRLQDFEYVSNSDGTYTITGWKGTLNGVASTELIIPNNPLIKL